jgi:hypothetical protein
MVRGLLGGGDGTRLANLAAIEMLPFPLQSQRNPTAFSSNPNELIAPWQKIFIKPWV